MTGYKIQIDKQIKEYKNVKIGDRKRVPKIINEQVGEAPGKRLKDSEIGVVKHQV